VIVLALLMINWLTFWRDTNSHAATAHGVKAFAQKKYPDAIKSFAKASGVAPTPARAFNLGTAEIAAGNREGGASTLGAALRDPSFRADALFNRGNAALASNAYDYAIRDYTDTLKLRPSDAAAKRNLEIALHKRAMQQQKNSGKGGGGAMQPPPQQKASKPEQPLEEQQKDDANTEALLRSVQQQEQEELQRMNRPVRRKVHVGW
jgi:tetratricopeptide (TPR) repeat protein